MGVLLANLGTPDAPDAPALRRYLREFLLDPRVIEMPRVLWWLILHLFVLPFRPRQVGRALQEGLDAGGLAPPASSPTARRPRSRRCCGAEIGTPVHVAVGMRYGNPSVALGAARARRQGLPPHPGAAALSAVRGGDHRLDDRRRGRRADHLAVGAGDPHHPPLPRRPRLHPGAGGEHPRGLGAGGGSRRSSSSPSTASRSAISWRATPTSASATSSPAWPPRSCGSPASAGRSPSSRSSARRSGSGPTPTRRSRRWRRPGLRRLDVVCPGFSADCLETIEEIDEQNREIFLHAGGEHYRYIPALNDRPDHIRVIADLVHRNLQGWVKSPAEWSQERDRREEEAAESRQRAEAMAGAVPLTLLRKRYARRRPALVHSDF